MVFEKKVDGKGELEKPHLRMPKESAKDKDRVVRKNILNTLQRVYYANDFLVDGENLLDVYKKIDECERRDELVQANELYKKVREKLLVSSTLLQGYVRELLLQMTNLETLQIEKYEELRNVVGRVREETGSVQED